MIYIKLILISGKAQHGKDTFAKILKQKLEQQNKKILVTHYADLVKHLATNLFNWDGQKDEKGRTILQKVGTDIVRTQRPNFWVDFIIDILTLFKGEWDYVLIPDCRFANELNRYGEEWDTTTVRVNRLNFTSTLTQEQQNHPSETSLDDYYFDYVINAENGLDKLEKEVDKFLEWMENVDE